MKTPIDGPEHVVDSGEEFENLERAEEEQRQLISEYKVKTKAKKPAASAGDTDAAEDLEVDKMMSKFGKTYLSIYFFSPH